MAYKLITGHDAKPGSYIMVNNEECVVKSQDISKTGKHGASKARIEAIGVFDGKKRVIAVPGHERFEVPMINKLKGQVISIQDNKASLMDLESFETFDVSVDDEIKAELHEGDNVEYWESNGKRIIKRKS